MFPMAGRVGEEGVLADRGHAILHVVLERDRADRGVFVSGRDIGQGVLAVGHVPVARRHHPQCVEADTDVVIAARDGGHHVLSDGDVARAERQRTERERVGRQVVDFVVEDARRRCLRRCGAPPRCERHHSRRDPDPCPSARPRRDRLSRPRVARATTSEAHLVPSLDCKPPRLSHTAPGRVHISRDLRPPPPRSGPDSPPWWAHHGGEREPCAPRLRVRRRPGAGRTAGDRRGVVAASPHDVECVEHLPRLGADLSGRAGGDGLGRQARGGRRCGARDDDRCGAGSSTVAARRARRGRRVAAVRTRPRDGLARSTGSRPKPAGLHRRSGRTRPGARVAALRPGAAHDRRRPRTYPTRGRNASVLRRRDGQRQDDVGATLATRPRPVRRHDHGAARARSQGRSRARARPARHRRRAWPAVRAL